MFTKNKKLKKELKNFTYSCAIGGNIFGFHKVAVTFKVTGFFKTTFTQLRTSWKPANLSC